MMCPFRIACEWSHEEVASLSLFGGGDSDVQLWRRQIGPGFILPVCGCRGNEGEANHEADKGCPQGRVPDLGVHLWVEAAITSAAVMGRQCESTSVWARGCYPGNDGRGQEGEPSTLKGQGTIYHQDGNHKGQSENSLPFSLTWSRRPSGMPKMVESKQKSLSLHGLRCLSSSTSAHADLVASSPATEFESASPTHFFNPPCRIRMSATDMDPERRCEFCLHGPMSFDNCASAQITTFTSLRVDGRLNATFMTSGDLLFPHLMTQSIFQDLAENRRRKPPRAFQSQRYV
jgi:hypothetical protein